jgi:hypothetical protein
MPTLSEQQHEFRRVSEVLIKLGLIMDTKHPVPTSLGGRRVRLASPVGRGDGSVHLITGSLRERIELDEAGMYTWKLVNGALIQLMWEFERDQLVKHRYAYLPSPLPPPKTPAEDCQGLGERLGELLDDVADDLRLGGAFRVDYDQDAAGPAHPATHLTLYGAGLEEGRTPIKGPWCLTRFVQLVFCSIAPPTEEIDGRRRIDTAARAELTRLTVNMTSRSLDPPHDAHAWIAWGRSG